MVKGCDEGLLVFRVMDVPFAVVELKKSEQGGKVVSRGSADADGRDVR